MTEPPPRADAEGEASAWRVHDAYLGDQVPPFEGHLPFWAFAIALLRSTVVNNDV